MILRLESIIGSGATADVFCDGNTAYKLFVSAQHLTRRVDPDFGPEDDERRRNIFGSQRDAYEIALNDAFLRNHVPNFHGVRHICDVRDRTDESIAGHYMLELCYAIDFIKGRAENLTDYFEPTSGEFAHIPNALGAFRKAGIRHLIDASVFAPESEQNFRIIDFAVRDFPA